jgi:hypothetical protein
MDRGSSATGLFSDGVSHLPRRPVADETNRIEIFQCRTRRDKQTPALEILR